MDKKKFENYVGFPVLEVKEELEKIGYKVNVIKNSKMKIESDYELVIKINCVNDKEIDIITGEFLINIENIKS